MSGCKEIQIKTNTSTVQFQPNSSNCLMPNIDNSATYFHYVSSRTINDNML